MSHLFRFLAQKPTSERGGLWAIGGDELKHLRKVLRLEVGADVEVCDGDGSWGRGQIASLDNTAALVEVRDAHFDPAPATQLQIAFGALKPGAVDEILPALTELGVDVIHVFGQLETAKARLAEKAVARWQRILFQSVKQCKRSWLPRLVVHKHVGAMIEWTQDLDRKTCGRFLLAPGAKQTLLDANPAIKSSYSTVLAVLGGEIGLHKVEEEALAAAGFSPVSLGPNVLRAVTAAVAAGAVLTARYRR